MDQKTFKYDRIIKGKPKRKQSGPFESTRIHSDSILIMTKRPGDDKHVYVWRTLTFWDPTIL